MVASRTKDQRGAALAGLRSPDPATRAAALRWLGVHAPAALTAADAALLDDPDLEVRAAAAVALRASPDPALANGARRALRGLLAGPRPARHAGLRAARDLANPFTIPRLFPFLDDPDSATRRLALRAIAVPTLGLVAPALLVARVAPLAHDPDPAVRATARALLRRLEAVGIAPYPLP